VAAYPKEYVKYLNTLRQEEQGRTGTTVETPEQKKIREEKEKKEKKEEQKQKEEAEKEKAKDDEIPDTSETRAQIDVLPLSYEDKRALHKELNKIRINVKEEHEWFGKPKITENSLETY
jgi:hypothetical protein